MNNYCVSNVQGRPPKQLREEKRKKRIGTNGVKAFIQISKADNVMLLKGAICLNNQNPKP
jgi:hypothetical protein